MREQQPEQATRTSNIEEAEKQPEQATRTSNIEEAEEQPAQRNKKRQNPLRSIRGLLARGSHHLDTHFVRISNRGDPHGPHF